jgi:hypothetical protein
MHYSDLNSEYQETVQAYRSSSNPDMMTQLGNQMDTQYAELMEKRDDLNLFMMITAGVYGLNLLDRLFVTSPNRIYARERRSGGSSSVALNPGPGSIRFSINF